MKKALAFLMAAVMLMSMLTACGNKNNAGKKDNNDVNTEETDKAAADKVAEMCIRDRPSTCPPRLSMALSKLRRVRVEGSKNRVARILPSHLWA